MAGRASDPPTLGWLRLGRLMLLVEKVALASAGGVLAVVHDLLDLDGTCR